MKKIALPLIATVLAFGTATAQDKPYNKWSIDLNAGITKPTNPFTSGYYTKDFNFIHADGGVRYMFNNKFGLKADFGFDKFENDDNSKTFETKYYRTSLQGVVNLGRVLSFEEWTKVLNLQAHAGAGYSWMTSDNFSNKDEMAHFLFGLTGQVKLSSRVALNADFTMINNIGQSKAWDGASNESRRGFDGTMYNATLGLSIYLGGNDKHADWYFGDAITNKLADLDTRLTNVENKLVDSDNDGVADYLDQEPNTPAGAMVDTKGRAIDKNNNGIPDSFETYLEEKYGKLTNDVVMNVDDSALVKELINKGYVAAYFDFDKAQPTTTDGINFIVTYLRSNPSASVEVIGYADAVGNANYNKQLSEKRANNVKDILVKSGIAASKVSVVGNGEDTTIDTSSTSARKIARRVIFKVK